LLLTTAYPPTKPFIPVRAAGSSLAPKLITSWAF
jgi:hypothetical protein